ncbi:ubiquitin thioesterase OTU1 [Brachionus plicatilis]|uniref:Ubiquitin thioesterase OTU n=1 Tax=Brachionus plicatilis TaxID=10195 RepID=A0A3M7T7K9_BRAPC|nr:ubiquitin thioesterase OTU1 [Brachionus plicatilis]
MVGKSILLRVRTKSGIVRIDSLTSESNLQDLKKAIAAATALDENKFKMLSGYPPKLLTSSNQHTTLEHHSIKNGEMITLEETQSVSASPPAKQQAQLCRKVVPADNSCLFTSINYLMKGILDLNCQKEMRELIARTVRNDPVYFNEAILGKANSAYCDWIRNSTSWGGSIEIVILSKYFKMEICVVDIRSCRIDRFGEDCSYAKRIFVLYDGIHYDPINLIRENGSVQTQFSTDDDITFVKAISLAEEARTARKFTDVNNFKLRCLVCQEPLVGEKQAQEHAKTTAHINFGEF